MIVSSYGIHQDKDGIKWLQQGNGLGVNAVGLAGRSPFKVNGRSCPHDIDLTIPSPSAEAWNKFQEMLPHPLVQLFLPIPRRTRGVFYLTGGLPEARQLYRMASPIEAIKPLWMTKRKRLYDDLQSSNIQPLVVFDVTPEATTSMKEFGMYAADMPRPFIYLAQSGFYAPLNSTPLVWQDMTIEVPEELPWERIGAEVVRRYMRGEAYDN